MAVACGPRGGARGKACAPPPHAKQMREPASALPRTEGGYTTNAKEEEIFSDTPSAPFAVADKTAGDAPPLTSHQMFRNPINPTNRQNKSAKSQTPNESAEQIGKM